MDVEGWLKWVFSVFAVVTGSIAGIKVFAKIKHSSGLQKYKVEELEKEVEEIKKICEKLREHSQGYDIFKTATGAQLTAMNRTLEVISVNQMESQKILFEIFKVVSSPK